jgi:hypothetical protein
MEVFEMKSKRIAAIMTIGAVLGVLSIIAFAAQDKYTVQVPNGPAFSDFRGYESWQVVSVSMTDDPAVIKVIVANPVMIDAYRSGVPGNGKKFPDGSRIAKIEWIPKKSTEAPFSVFVPDYQKDVDFIEKDSKRFVDTSGWGFAEFAYDVASDTFKPTVKDAKCGYQCHTIVAKKTTFFTRISIGEQ